VFRAVAILGALLARWAIGTAAADLSTVEAVSVYVRGQQRDLAPDAVEVRELVTRCEQQLRDADDLLKLAVTPQTIRRIQATEVALEIRYRTPPTLQVAANGLTLRPLRLLIPLTGELAGSVTTIFHGRNAYDAGPYRNRAGTGQLASLVRELGVDFP
jgi:hypothetical protein